MTKAEGKGEVTDLNSKLCPPANLPIAVCTRGRFPYLSCLTSISLSAQASAETGGGAARNLSTIVFFAFGEVNVEQARRSLRFGRRRRVSGDFLNRLAGGAA